MAKGSTFPADDVPERTGQVLDVLRRHDPVPVPVTALYLQVEDKRALADEFARMEADGLIERVGVAPSDEGYAAARALAGSEVDVPVTLAAYRLKGGGRDRARP